LEKCEQSLQYFIYFRFLFFKTNFEDKLAFNYFSGFGFFEIVCGQTLIFSFFGIWQP